jgi:hypothetical protein
VHSVPAPYALSPCPLPCLTVWRNLLKFHSNF